MASQRRMSTRITTLICTFVLALPIASQAASDDDLATLRTQFQAMSERLDRLEAENRALTAANAELVKNNQDTVVTVTEVSEKTDAIAAEVKKQAEKTDWTDTMRWNGDFRYRYESFDIEGKPDRNRNRIRARAALIADVSPTIEVGLGIASGGEDPVSSNVTLGGGGSSKGLVLDLAYFDWSGMANTHVLGGKFKNYLVDSGSNALLWDSDWRPEGIGFSWANDLFFANAIGTWIESDSKKEQSFAYTTQAGINMNIGDDMKLVAGIGYYVFDTKGLHSFFGDDDDFFGNSFDPNTLTYLYNYEEIELFGGLGFSLFDRPVLVFTMTRLIPSVSNMAKRKNGMIGTLAICTSTLKQMLLLACWLTPISAVVVPMPRATFSRPAMAYPGAWLPNSPTSSMKQGSNPTIRSTLTAYSWT